MEFNVGDVVFLKSNPERLMTVSIVLGKTKFSGFFGKLYEKHSREIGFTDGDVQCDCFIGLEYNYGSFKANKLQIKSSDNIIPKLEVGDVVCLKSNPEIPMTISFVIKTSGIFFKKELEKQMRSYWYSVGDVQCTWGNKLNVFERFFSAAMLTKKS